VDDIDALKDRALELFLDQRADEALAIIQGDAALSAWAAANLKQPTCEDQRGQRFFAILNQANRAPSEALADLLELRGGERVLELGFGGGAGLVRAGRALQAGGGGFLGGVDLSLDCVAATRRALDERGFSDVEVELQAGCVTAIPFPDGAFDAVMHLNCWYFWPDLGQGLRECARVLRPGGTLLTGSKIEGLRGFFGDRLAEVREQAFRNVDLEAYEAAAREAGFVDVASSKEPGAAGQLEGVTVTRATRP